MTNEIIFRNGSALRPYVEIVELWVEKEKAFRWCATLGPNCLIAFDKETGQYDMFGETLVLSNDKSIWSSRLKGCWLSKEDAKEALISALNQDRNLFGHKWLFDFHECNDLARKTIMN